ncbi:MAG: LytTR family DNA-binding domain-containing protein [Bacteroidetes bacterium]|nr:LytTR family DNA-binding domain-containing protein [Bacteroidota bacterium]MBU1371698.1 LytTR family DNA-binding domain-containing protein [Bacteroidota bacterium]MBU1484139.1 LytTR family DNA-binding domain-containing protein [Bacteroidota bacterium]MBU1761270.1 LytTR family DNA-binding domain-containing protein [Bacteroidota bacterium]MBU2267356.1 LytTR family DNA-binding domain-containing protein [Bacteroidota bacterium]
MKAILIDDEISNLENLQTLLERHCPQVTIMATTQNVCDAVDAIEKYLPDLVFLDIQMGEQTGFDVLKLLPKRNFEVVFVTAYDQYGIQAVKFAALDYLLKPIDIEELKTAVNKAEHKSTTKIQNLQLDFLLQQLKKPETNISKIALQMQSEIRYVNLSEIIRCEADNTYTHFFLSNDEKILVSKSLKEYADLLRPNGFLRTHQSHLVNPKFVKSWLKEDGGILLLMSGEKIPISKPNKDTVKQALKQL